MDASQNVAPVILRSRTSRWPAIPMAEALNIVEERIKSSISVLQLIKTVNSSEAEIGDVLAENIYAEAPHPPFRASIKDGYAVVAVDGAGARRVVGTSTAEKTKIALNVHPGVCCRINTGASLPEGADAVVQVEDTKLLEHNNVEETLIEVLKAPCIGQDIREIGSDVSLGELLLESGTRLHPADLGLLALSNRLKVNIYDNVNLAVLSTGDELTDEIIDHTNDRGEHAIRDTNRPVLLALFKSMGANVHDMGIVNDVRELLVATVKKAFDMCHILVVTGGVSMGEKDLLKQILIEDFGFTIHFGRVMMKPGLPSTFASGIYKNETRFLFGLPGNPVSSFVCAHLFVCPMLRLIGGEKRYKPTKLSVQTIEEIKLDSRPEYRRACLVLTKNHAPLPSNIPQVECLAGSQISSRLLSLRLANLLLELPAKTQDREKIFQGDVVDALVIGPI